MAVMNLESLVLRGDSVVKGGIASMALVGSKQADRQAPASLSHWRRTSQCLPQADYNPGSPPR